MEAMQAQIQSLQEEMKSHKSETASKATPGYYKGRTDYYRGKQNNPARNGQEPFFVLVQNAMRRCFLNHATTAITVVVKIILPEIV